MILIITGAAERATLPPGPLDDELDDELHSFIVERKRVEPDRVLVVDDDDQILTVLQEILSEERRPDGSPLYEVEVAHGGKEAMLKILTGPPLDVILLDLMMPGVNGAAVYNFLRESDAYSEIPILFITAQAQMFRDIGALADPNKIHLSDPSKAAKLAARKAARTGTIPPPVEVLPKPFDLDALLAKVRSAAERSKGKPT